MVAINLSAYRPLLAEVESVTHHDFFFFLPGCESAGCLRRRGWTRASRPGHTNDGSSQIQGGEPSADIDPDSVLDGCQSCFV